MASKRNASATTLVLAYWDTGDEPFEATLEFLVSRPIVESDL